jgi:hypothetical protein
MILPLIGSGAAERKSSGCPENHVGLPDHLAGLLVGSDDPGRIVADRNDVIAPQRGAAIGRRPLLLGFHAPDDAANVA